MRSVSLTLCLFFFFLLCRVFVAAHGIFVAACGSFVEVHRLFVVMRGLLSSCGAQAPKHTGSVVAVRRLSCPAGCGILVPRPGMEPASPVLEGGFLTTGPPGKSHDFVSFSSHDWLCGCKHGVGRKLDLTKDCV